MSKTVTDNQKIDDQQLDHSQDSEPVNNIDSEKHAKELEAKVAANINKFHKTLSQKDRRRFDLDNPLPESNEVNAETDDGSDESENLQDGYVDDEGFDKDDKDLHDESETNDDGFDAAASLNDDSGAPTLPEPYRRSLLAHGYKESDIEANLKQFGLDFINTASQIHAHRNQEQAAWAAAGRRKIQQQSQLVDESTPTGSITPTSGLAPIDVKTLSAQVGDELAAAEIAKPINAAINEINTLLPQVQEVKKYMQEMQAQNVRQEVNAFFASDALKPYAELYGDGSQPVTDDQVQNRNRVLEVAHELMIGAEVLHNRALPFQEAFANAHDLISSEFKTSAIRTGLKKKAKQRQRGLTNRPRNKNTGPSSKNPQATLEQKVAIGIQKAFGTSTA